MEENNKPLYYRYVRTGNSIPRTRMRGGKEQKYLEAEVQKVFYDEEYVKSFSLDRYGLPLHNKIQNYTVVENYLLDFWSPIMGGDAVYTFILLMRHCYGFDADGNKKDYSFPQLETIAEKSGKTVPTIKKYLDVLEEHYFIYRFWRSNPENHHTDDSILYKLRTSIPYLSEEHLVKLSPKLQKQHERFLNQIMGKYNASVEIASSYDYSEEFKQILEDGKAQATRKMTLEEIEEYHKIREEQLRNKVTAADKETWELMLGSLKDKISSPSLQTWFKNNFCIVEADTLLIYTPTKFVAEWIENRYIELIEKAYEELQGNKPTEIKILVVQDRL
ncbi:DnaA N-terminal domain-containing protein [Paenibacillus sp. IITD108]|uniref:DnaA N-terminal domain-containing protein n=1 Tax=Paenibacillus sp. IITD108 TaxID=3116649 RepID=UPI002F3F193B